MHGTRRICLSSSLLLLCLTLALDAWAQPGSASAEPSPAEKEAEELFDRVVPVEEGDHCIICGKLLQPSDTVYLVEGQRVGVKEQMEGQLLSNPWAYLGQLKPRGGLFGGEVRPGSISDAWLLFGMYVVLGLVFSALCAHRALNNGLPAIRWLFAGLFFNVLAYLALMIRSTDFESRPALRYAGVVKIPSTAEPAECPSCGNLNHPCANQCSSCGAELTPAAPSEVTRLNPATK